MTSNDQSQTVSGATILDADDGEQEQLWQELRAQRQRASALFRGLTASGELDEVYDD